MKSLKNYIQRDCTKLNKNNLSKFKRAWGKEIGFIPKNSQVLGIYNQLLKEKKITSTADLRALLTTRKTRTQSGVVPMAVMTKPFPCPGECIYCPQEKGMPKSYLSDEPAAQRAKKVDFDPKLQIESRLKQLKATGHTTDKVEIIIIGGTFSAYPQEYKLEFFKTVFDTLNNKTSKNLISKNLKQAQELNEKAKHRVVGISIETRPDWVTKKEIKLLRKLGVTKIQLGVQALDGKTLKTIKRGHSLKAVTKATQLLKNAGFKICYHIMPNLPGSTPKNDINMAKKMFQDPRFKPDYLKIYPAQVIPGTQLDTLFKEGKFKTYPDNVLKKTLKTIKRNTPPWVRIDRLVRDISKQWVSSGTFTTNIRQIILQELEKENEPCQCIRCREIKGDLHSKSLSLKKIMIDTLGGKEYFFSFESKGKLYSLLRLRLPKKNQPVLFKELKDTAIIREVHTFGSALALNEYQQSKTQHQGLGRKLIKEAEKISKKNGFKKLAVISAIGTKEYYLKLGFKKNGLYMTKDI
jgi:elongator complex protein 3